MLSGIPGGGNRMCKGPQTMKSMSCAGTHTYFMLLEQKKCEESVGSKTEQVVWVKCFESD